MCYIENEEQQLVINTFHITNAIIEKINRGLYMNNIYQSISMDVGYLLHLGYSIYRTMDIISEAIKYKENR